eukprot:70021-Rhodomonas_salina.5
MMRVVSASAVASKLLPHGWKCRARMACSSARDSLFTFIASRCSSCSSNCSNSTSPSRRDPAPDSRTWRSSCRTAHVVVSMGLGLAAHLVLRDDAAGQEDVERGVDRVGDEVGHPAGPVSVLVDVCGARASSVSCAHVRSRTPQRIAAGDAGREHLALERTGVWRGGVC